MLHFSGFLSHKLFVVLPGGSERLVIGCMRLLHGDWMVSGGYPAAVEVLPGVLDALAIGDLGRM